VAVASANSYKLTYETDGAASEIEYTLGYTVNDESKTGDGTILSVESGTTEDEVELSFSTTTDKVGNASAAGTHKDTLTFTVDLDEAENDNV
jgi:hypothetical protein